MANGTSKSIIFGGYTVSFYNWIDLIGFYIDIYLRGEYKFKPTTKKPYILDCGSEFGMSMLYFKKVFPDAEIVCFEPTSSTYELLKKNIKQNNLSSVKPVKAAVAKKKGTAKFYINNGNGVTWGNSLVGGTYILGSHNVEEVKTVKLSSYITKHVDLVKIDIEGTEVDVLEEIEPKLDKVENIILELHTKGEDNVKKYKKIEKILKRNGFRFTIRTAEVIFRRNVNPEKIGSYPDNLFLITAKNN